MEKDIPKDKLINEIEFDIYVIFINYFKQILGIVKNYINSKELNLVKYGLKIFDNFFQRKIENEENDNNNTNEDNKIIIEYGILDNIFMLLKDKDYLIQVIYINL